MKIRTKNYLPLRQFAFMTSSLFFIGDLLAKEPHYQFLPTGNILMKVEYGQAANKLITTLPGFPDPLLVVNDEGGLDILSGRTISKRAWIPVLPAKPKTPKPASRGEAWDQVYVELQALNGSYKGVGIVTAEPDFEVRSRAFFTDDSRSAGKNAPIQLVDETESPKITKWANPHWPRPDELDWHLGPNYSQLHEAFEAVKARRLELGTERVKIAALDTGAWLGHLGSPDMNRVKKLVSFPRDSKEVPYVDEKTVELGKELELPAGWLSDAGHGTFTLGVLAGRQVNFPPQEHLPQGFNGVIGGNPDADLYLAKIGKSVVHFDFEIVTRFSEMAMGFNYAVSQNCQVISMAAGGPPNRIIQDAVNTAYENGTAMFCATGDFLRSPILFWISTPKSVVYPAAFKNVMAVAGVTSRGDNYGHIPHYFSFISNWNISDWRMRGSYGPQSSMINCVSAYSPNVVRASYEGKNSSVAHFEATGGGTSAATPQVAAAASLWLEYYQKDLAAYEPWQRIELVYDALKKAAKARSQYTYANEYTGWGPLRAMDALRYAPADIVHEHPAVLTVKHHADYVRFFDLIKLLLSMIKPGVALNSDNDVGLALKAVLDRDGSLKLDEQGAAGIAQSMATELAQLAYEDEKLQAAIEKMPTGGRNEGAILNLARALAKSKDSSRVLSALALRVENQATFEKIDLTQGKRGRR